MALLPENLSFSRKVLPIIAIGALVLAVIFIAMGLPDREQSEPEKEPPRAIGELANGARVAGSGIVEPSSELIEVGTALSGLVTDLMVQPGQFVEKGQPLFTVDTRAIRARAAETQAAITEARAALGEARASMNEAEAAIAEARTAEQTAARQLALYRGVDDPAAVSRSEVIRAEGEAASARDRRRLAETRLQQARARVDQANARIQSAQSQAGTTRTELSRATVRAPIAGEILAVNIRPGEFLSNQGGGNSAPFITMGETRPLHIRVDIDEEQAGRLAMGQPATVSPRGAADNQVKASFVRAEPQVVPKRQLTNTASERVDVRVLQIIYALPAEARDAFRVGQQVDAFIPATDGAQGSSGE